MYQTKLGGGVSLVAAILVFVYAIVRLGKVERAELVPDTSQNEKYCLFANFIPEVAGMVVLGKMLLKFLITPYA
jgi:hypothetical protein